MENNIVKKYFRNEIIEKNLIYRKDLMEVSYSKHCLERLEQRLNGSLKFLPKFLRITESNIAAGTSSDGVKLDSVTVRIDYKTDIWCFLIVDPSNKKVITIVTQIVKMKKKKSWKNSFVMLYAGISYNS